MAEAVVNFFSAEARINQSATAHLIGHIAYLIGGEFPINPASIVPGDVVIADVTNADQLLFDTLAEIAEPKNVRNETVVPILLMREKGSVPPLDERLIGSPSFRPDGISYDPDQLIIVKMGIQTFLHANKVLRRGAEVIEPDPVLDDDTRFDDEAGIQLF